MDLSRIGEHADLWEKASRKLRGSLMPPPGNRQPDRAAVESFAGWLEGELDRAASITPNPGTVGLHRLNRAEYAASIRELFDIDVDANLLLPADDTSQGFDNIADVLKISPAFLEQYVVAARAVSIDAVGSPRPSGIIRATLRASDNPDPGGGWAPLGTQGVMLAEHLFPGEGDYEIRGAQGQVITLDGARVAANGRVRVTAGLHKVGVTVVQRSNVESDATLQALNAGGEAVRGRVPGVVVAVRGAAGSRSPDRTIPSGLCSTLQTVDVLLFAGPARRHPKTKSLPVRLRSFRRWLDVLTAGPATDADLAAPLAFFKDGRSRGDFEAGIQAGLMPILASPKFLYRAEPAPAGVQPGAIYKLNDLELASRLSFFLWSQIPDDELSTLALRQQLSDPAVLEKQVRRMLADSRSKALVTNFAFQWLRIRELDRAQPDSTLFPNFDAGLRQALRREIELFVDSVFRDDRNVMDLVTADYTFLNERLASHYGVEGVQGQQFMRVRLADSDRWGLLGKGAILVVTSFPNRTSIVRRGAWVLETSWVRRLPRHLRMWRRSRRTRKAKRPARFGKSWRSTVRKLPAMRVTP
jgi:hypothetical protein